MTTQTSDSVAPDSGPADSPEISVVIPVYREAGAIVPLLAEVVAAMEGADYEIVVVDDGSDDGTAAALRSANRLSGRVRVVTLERNFGQSAAILAGVRAARGRWIATLDGDGQNDPADIPGLLAARTPEGEPVLVCGIRQGRKDRWSKRAASRVANAVRGRILGDEVEDSGCGLKALPRDLFLRLPAFDHMHRFLPALARARGVSVITVPVGHRPRKAGRSKYGILDRLAAGVVDLLGVSWLLRRTLHPEVASVDDGPDGEAEEGSP